MQDVDDGPVLAGVTDNKSPETLMEQLRAQRQELADAKETFLTINGYEQFGLTVKYRLLDRVEVEKIAKRVRKITRDRSDFNMLILIDTIINATDGFYVREMGVTDPQPLTNGDDGPQIVTWDELARFLGASDEQAGTARNGLYFIFGNNEWMIGQQGISLQRWMNNTGLEVDNEFLGEPA